MATKPRGGGAKCLSGRATKKRTFFSASLGGFIEWNISEGCELLNYTMTQHQQQQKKKQQQKPIPLNIMTTAPNQKEKIKQHQSKR